MEQISGFDIRYYSLFIILDDIFFCVLKNRPQSERFASNTDISYNHFFLHRNFAEKQPQNQAFVKVFV